MARRLNGLLGREPVRFVITGVAAAALLATLTFVALRSPLPPFAGTLLAYGITVVASYTAQQAWTFRGRHGHGRAFPRYCAAQVLCAGFTAGLAQLLVHAGFTPAATAVTTTILASAASYALSRFWVFPADPS